MLQKLLPLTLIMVPMMVAAWLGWRLLDDAGFSVALSLLVGVTVAPSFARIVFAEMPRPRRVGQ